MSDLELLYMKKINKTKPFLSGLIVIVAVGFLLLSNSFKQHTAGTFIGPVDLVGLPMDNQVCIAEFYAQNLTIIDIETNEVVNTIPLAYKPQRLFVSGNKLLVIGGEEDGILEVYKTTTMELLQSTSLGHYPADISESDDHYIVTNRFKGQLQFLSKVDLSVSKVLEVGREPIASVYVKDRNQLYVVHHLPEMASTEKIVTSKISVIDTESQTIIKTFLLPNGSAGIRNIDIHASGEYILVTHQIARFGAPTSQLEKGWMNTNALSIIEVESMDIWASVLLDDIDLGAATPWEVISSQDGSQIYVAHAGSHELSVIDWESLTSAISDYKSNPDNLKLTYNLAFIKPHRTRVKLLGNGPRSLITINNKVLVANYFSGNLNMVDIEDHSIAGLTLGNNQLNSIQRGERNFNDAQLCFQQWQSCATCHLDARVDGYNWDELIDGLGNPKNVKSLLLAHQTPPSLSLGIRANAEATVRAGFRHLLFAEVSEKHSAEVDSYLKSLQPVKSPHNFKTAEINAGKQVFNDQGCVKCHTPPLYTNLGQYQLDDKDGLKWDTPTLVEAWRTGPYWHDGRFESIKDVFEKGRHSITNDISKEKIAQLEKYLLSL